MFSVLSDAPRFLAQELYWRLVYMTNAVRSIDVVVNCMGDRDRSGKPSRAFYALRERLSRHPVIKYSFLLLCVHPISAWLFMMDVCSC